MIKILDIDNIKIKSMDAGNNMFLMNKKLDRMHVMFSIEGYTKSLWIEGEIFEEIKQFVKSKVIEQLNILENE